MGIFAILLLAVSLAIDCFTVSVTSGIILRRIRWNTFLTMAFFFGFFQALMPLLGWLGASHFSHLIEAYDHWVAFGLLAFLGIRMIREHFKDSEEHSFDPTRLKVIITLAIATSIDALAVGISFAFTGFKELPCFFRSLPSDLPRSSSRWQEALSASFSGNASTCGWNCSAGWY